MILLSTLAFTLSTANAADRDACDDVAALLDAADPSGPWARLPVTVPSTPAARAKADILIEALDARWSATLLNPTLLRARPWDVVPSTGQALVGVEPDEIDFDTSLKGIDPDEIDFDTSLMGIDPDEIDVAAMLKTGLDWLVINPDGAPACLLLGL